MGLGRRGEDAAADWYEERSYRVLARNWRGTDGEIDLVLRSPGDEVVFCEVKTRASGRFGTPFDAVTAAKQRRLRHLAAEWLRRGRAGGAFDRGRAGGAFGGVRFDVAAVGPGPGGTLRVEVLEDAF